LKNSIEALCKSVDGVNCTTNSNSNTTQITFPPLENVEQVQKQQLDRLSRLQEMEKSVEKLQNAVEANSKVLQLTIGQKVSDIKQTLFKEIDIKEAKISDVIKDINQQTQKQCDSVKQQVENLEKVFQ